uniref:Uncharacterized protein n=1 Tax=Tanacetum cinerariifolium TaxID=118510 RepID=A0A699HK56_TANCI|nr:hypothetical protein [Tanacetum cinerariifolium]
MQNCNGLVYVTTDTNGMIKVLPPKTAKEVVVRERERKARTTLLMALPEDHLAIFHKMADAKEMWEAIKSRFQTLLSQLETHGAGVSHEDANQKFLRSLPSFWSQVALIMRTKPGLDTLGFDDLSTNDVSTAYSVSSPSISNSQKEGSLSYTDEVIHSFFVNQSSAPQLDYDDLKQINDDDMEEMDLKWFMKIDLDDKTNVLAYHKKLLAKDLKEKEDLKTKFENWQNSSKNLSRLLNTQMSAHDKFGLGYGDYRYEGILSYENEVLQSVFMNKESDLEDTSVNDRYAKGMHAVPPPMTGNYMPSRSNVEIDYSKFTYGLKQTSVNDSKSSEYVSCEFDSRKTTTSMPELIDNAPKVVCAPKV